MAISDKNDRLTIIIPKVMKDKLKIIADHHNRSLSNYIVSVLSEQIYEEIDQMEMYGHYDVAKQLQGENPKFIHMRTQSGKTYVQPIGRGERMVADSDTDYKTDKDSNKYNK